MMIIFLIKGCPSGQPFYYGKRSVENGVDIRNNRKCRHGHGYLLGGE